MKQLTDNVENTHGRMVGRCSAHLFINAFEEIIVNKYFASGFCNVIQSVKMPSLPIFICIRFSPCQPSETNNE